MWRIAQRAWYDAIVSGLGPERLDLGVCLHEPGMRRELLDAVKSPDVVNLVQDGQRQDLADAGDGSEPMKRVGIMAFGFPHDRELEIGDELVVLVNQGHVHFNALADARVRKVVDDPVAIARGGEALLEGRQVVVRAGILDVDQQLAALTDQALDALVLQ